MSSSSVNQTQVIQHHEGPLLFNAGQQAKDGSFNREFLN